MIFNALLKKAKILLSISVFVKFAKNDAPVTMDVIDNKTSNPCTVKKAIISAMFNPLVRGAVIGQ